MTDDAQTKGAYILVRVLMRRLGDKPVTITTEELTAALLLGGLKTERDDAGNIRVWIEGEEST